MNFSDDLRLVQKALPLDEDAFADDEYVLPEEDRIAMEYLKSVRKEAAQVPSIYKSKEYDRITKG